MTQEQDRERMVREQVEERGIRDARVLDALRRTPRHRFLPPAEAYRAYADCPVAIGCGQTASQPYMVGLMSECLALSGGERVLEIGTGSGYQTAVLSRLAGRVFSVERIPELSSQAERALGEQGCANVEFRVGDGTLGWPEDAPFDRVLVAAAAPRLPERLFDQVVEGGLLVVPVGTESGQALQVVEKVGGGRRVRSVCSCMFVKLLGEEGW